MCNCKSHEHLTVAKFRELMPAFADEDKYPDADIERWIERAKCAFNVCIWGCSLEWGEANWIAHQLSLTGTEAVPPIARMSFATSKRVGDTAVSYSEGIATAIMKEPFLWTPYGQQYLSLRDSLSGGIGLLIV